MALAVHKQTVHTAQNQAPANRKYGLTPGTPTTLTNPYAVEKPAHKDTNKTIKVGTQQNLANTKVNMRKDAKTERNETSNALKTERPEI